MDYSVIIEMIGSVGFPIFACVVMFMQNKEMQKTLSELVVTLTTMNERLSDVEKAVSKND